MFYVAIETEMELDPNIQYVVNVYGPFPSLEDAEDFRSKHPNKVWIDCYSLTDPKESS